MVRGLGTVCKSLIYKEFLELVLVLSLCYNGCKLRRERRDMRVDQLHALIQKFAQDEENLRTDADMSVIWDFVAADVHMSEEYKRSDFTADDVEEALHQVSERWGV